MSRSIYCVIGGGIGGVSCAKELARLQRIREAQGDDFDIILITASNHVIEVGCCIIL